MSTEISEQANGSEKRNRQDGLEGRVFSRLTVIAACEKRPYENKKYLCMCSCGKMVEVCAHNLLNSNSKSCGCYQKDFPSRLRHGENKTRLYTIWVNMRQRCSKNPRGVHNNWVGRGISVCQEWEVYETFRDWAMSNGYTKELTIDRINNNGNYEPDNCRWATYKQQGNNKRDNRMLTFDGVTKTLTQWADSYGISCHVLRYRIKMGDTGERLSRKVGNTGKRKGEKE